MAAIASLGRLPEADEFPQAAEGEDRFGSLKRAFALVKRVTGPEEWDAIARRSTEDLLVDLALARSRSRCRPPAPVRLPGGDDRPAPPRPGPARPVRLPVRRPREGGPIRRRLRRSRRCRSGSGGTSGRSSAGTHATGCRRAAGPPGRRADELPGRSGPMSPGGVTDPIQSEMGGAGSGALGVGR